MCHQCDWLTLWTGPKLWPACLSNQNHIHSWQIGWPLPPWLVLLSKGLVMFALSLVAVWVGTWLVNASCPVGTGISTLAVSGGQWNHLVRIWMLNWKLIEIHEQHSVWRNKILGLLKSFMPQHLRWLLMKQMTTQKMGLVIVNAFSDNEFYLQFRSIQANFLNSPNVKYLYGMPHKLLSIHSDNTFCRGRALPLVHNN